MKYTFYCRFRISKTDKFKFDLYSFTKKKVKSYFFNRFRFEEFARFIRLSISRHKFSWYSSPAIELK